MDSSTLETTLENLASKVSGLENSISFHLTRSASLSRCLEFWTWLVVIGVVVEVVVEVKDYFHTRRESRCCLIAPSLNPSKLDLFWKMSGAVLVAAGVAGELYIGGRITEVQSQLQTENRALVGLLNEKATLQSSAAIERAASAELRAAELLARIQPRDLTAAQIAGLKQNLPPFGTKPIFLVTYAGDVESARLATQIKKALLGSGWANPIGNTQAVWDMTGVVTVRADPVYGIWIGENLTGRDSTGLPRQSSEEGGKLIKVLSAWLGPTTKIPFPELNARLIFPLTSGPVMIFVGPKPLRE